MNKKLLLIGFFFITSNCVCAHENWHGQLKLPSQLLGEVQRNYITQGGKCAVSVKEEIIPGELQVGDTKIVFPYICIRRNHVYHCPPPIPRRGGERAPAHQYSGNVTADYKVVDGNLSALSNITNAKNHEETDCGAVIVNYLKSITLQ